MTDKKVSLEEMLETFDYLVEGRLVGSVTNRGLATEHLEECATAIRAALLVVGELASEAEWLRKNYFDADVVRRTEKLLERLIKLRDLGGANLGGANLGGANLGGADLGGANLGGANLNVKAPPVNSHAFVSEILVRVAKKEVEIDLACRIGRKTEDCWEYFIKLARKKKVLKWAKKALSEWPEFMAKFKEFGA